eukprot:scaffold655_cov162-Amphora_coffeaeformis.AAC.21
MNSRSDYSYALLESKGVNKTDRWLLQRYVVCSTTIPKRSERARLPFVAFWLLVPLILERPPFVGPLRLKV